jgi:metallo-beta-lactamase class B
MRACILVLLILLSPPVSAQRAPYLSLEQRVQIFGDWGRPVEPFRIVGNIHYVGAQNIAVYLFSTPEGHIVIDSGTSIMQAQFQKNVEKLGFKVADIKILLSSHAHVDHVQGHAFIKRLTGAQVMAITEDAKALEAGADLSPIAEEGWEPVKVDRVLKDGDTVSLGGTTLRAVWTPGHTPGCTTWTTTVKDSTRSYNVIFPCGVGPNTGPPLVGNKQHPDIIEQTLNTVKKLRALNPDMILSGHPQQTFAGKIERIKAEERPHPLLVEPGAWPKQVDNQEANFRKRLEAEKAKSAAR